MRRLIAVVLILMLAAGSVFCAPAKYGAGRFDEACRLAAEQTDKDLGVNQKKYDPAVVEMLASGYVNQTFRAGMFETALKKNQRVFLGISLISGLTFVTNCSPGLPLVVMLGLSLYHAQNTDAIIEKTNKVFDTKSKGGK